MANKGGNRHLKRLAAPKTMKISRKTNVWVSKPAPGKHKLQESVAISVLLKDYLNLANNLREIKYILNNGDILVDGKPVKDNKLCVGLMDIVSIPKIGKEYLITNKNGKLTPIETKEGEKLCKIVGKQIGKKGKITLVSHDGRNFIVDKKEYKIGDTLKVKVPEQKIVSHLPMKPGVNCLIIKGKHAGDTANLVEVIPSTARRAAGAKLKSGETEFITLKEYLFVLGE